MDAAAELGRNPPASKHQIQPEYGDEQAGAGRACRTNPSRETKFSCTHADREIFIFPVQLTTCRTGNLTRLIHATLAICVIMHTMGKIKNRPYVGRYYIGIILHYSTFHYIILQYYIIIFLPYYNVRAPAGTYMHCCHQAQAVNRLRISSRFRSSKQSAWFTQKAQSQTW